MSVSVDTNNIPNNKKIESPQSPIDERPDPKKSSLKEILKYSLQKFLNGFYIGYGSRSVLSLLVRIFSLLKGGKIKKVFTVAELVSEKKLIVREEAVRIGLFLGGFSGLFSLIKLLLDKYRDSKSGLHSFIAGSLASSSLIFQEQSSQRTMALYLLARVFQCAYNTAKELKYLPFTDEYTHGDSILFILSSAQIMYSWVMKPNTLPISYSKFITNTGPIVAPVLKVVKDTNRNMVVNGEEIVNFFKKQGIFAPLIDPHAKIVGCDILHPQNSSCVKHNISVFLDTARKILPLYSSLVCVPVVIFRLKKLIKEPLTIAKETGVNIIRSVSFLSAFVALYMTVICLHRKVVTKDNRFIYFIAGLVCSSSIFIEKKSRRSELALYTLPRAIDSLYLIMTEKKWLSGVKNGEVYLFIIQIHYLLYYIHF
eukprot:gene2121-1987_t